jgi:hypothetical protein
MTAALLVVAVGLSLLQAQSQEVGRDERLAALRARAQERLEQDRLVYSDSELRDIEARYGSGHQDMVSTVFKPRGESILTALIARYPKSMRAGCAVLELAQNSRGEVRKKYLDLAIARHGDAWCADGVQVGGLARALLAMDYVSVDRFDEAERIAREMLRLYPGAVDSAGAPLDSVLDGIKLLRPPK